LKNKAKYFKKEKKNLPRLLTGFNFGIEPGNFGIPFDKFPLFVATPLFVDGV